MGLAVYNSINLDLHFPACCYKKLLSPAVVPFNNPRATVGVAPITLDDLKIIQPVSAMLGPFLWQLYNYSKILLADRMVVVQVNFKNSKKSPGLEFTIFLTL